MLVTLVVFMAWGAGAQEVIIQRHFKGDIYTSSKFSVAFRLRELQLLSNFKLHILITNQYQRNINRQLGIWSGDGWWVPQECSLDTLMIIMTMRCKFYITSWAWVSIIFKALSMGSSLHSITHRTVWSDKPWVCTVHVAWARSHDEYKITLAKSRTIFTGRMAFSHGWIFCIKCERN